MHRIDGPGATVDNKFTEGDPAAATPATTVTDDWLNDLQENVCKVIEDAGIALLKGSYSQLKNAIASMISNSSLDLLNTTRVSVPSAATVSLTVAAPSSRHINITGTTTISAFTVDAGKCYFVRFDASLTLTNSASLVTQSGANITTAAGDTCLLRATAANVVEVLCYTPGIPQELGYRQTWQNLTASRASGTTYTNTSGRPIAISVYGSNPSGVVGITVTVSGVVVAVQGSASNHASNVSTIVPPGATYSVSITGASSWTWSELRG